MNLKAALEFLGVVCEVNPCELHDIQIDSRKVSPGTLFVAIPGLKTDGREFVRQAVDQGAAAVLVASPYEAANPLGRVPVIAVPDLVAKLPALAAFFYQNPAAALNLIGITGTNGKTSCSHYTAQILNAANVSCGVMGTLGNGLLPNLNTAPLTTADCCSVQQQFAAFKQQQATTVAMEVSSHALDQGRLTGINFDTVVFTNLSQDHLDYHTTMEEYFAAKCRLFTEYKTKTCVLNLDDPYTVQILSLIPLDCKIITYSLSNPAADIYLAKNNIYTPWGNGTLVCPLIGKFNLSNVLACIACAAVQGVSLTTILAAVANLIPVAGRMQQVTTNTANAPLVVIDYAHTPDALITALQTLREYSNSKLHCVFGCGGDRDRSKRPLMLRAAIENSDSVVITQDNSRTEDPQQIIRDMLSDIIITSKINIELDRTTAINNAIAQAGNADIVLIAGKGHEDYQIIGTQKFPFSDLLVAQQALALRS